MANHLTVEALRDRCNAARANGDPRKYLAGLSVEEAHAIAQHLERLVPRTFPNPVKKVCESCGSENVWKDANAQWSDARQEYELLDLFEPEYCNDCDAECTIIEEPADAPV